MDEDTEPTTEDGETPDLNPGWQEGNEANLRRQEAETRRQQREAQAEEPEA